MPGTLVPLWWEPTPPAQSDVILASFCWGFTMALACFCVSKAYSQTYRSCARVAHARRPNAYIVMVWLLTAANIVVAVDSWLYTMDLIPPR